MLCRVGKKIPDYWDASKRLLADPTRFLDNLLQYDKENIPDSTIKKVVGRRAACPRLTVGG
jgi:dynein heavy chain